MTQGPVTTARPPDGRMKRSSARRWDVTCSGDDEGVPESLATCIPCPSPAARGARKGVPPLPVGERLGHAVSRISSASRSDPHSRAMYDGVRHVETVLADDDSRPGSLWTVRRVRTHEPPSRSCATCLRLSDDRSGAASLPRPLTRPPLEGSRPGAVDAGLDDSEHRTLHRRRHQDLASVVLRLEGRRGRSAMVGSGLAPRSPGRFARQRGPRRCQAPARTADRGSSPLVWRAVPGS